jgi:DNA-binding FadR family transcriptional regulator
MVSSSIQRAGVAPAGGEGEAGEDRGESALTQLRAWLAQADPAPGMRLPPERELAETLGVGRGDLRRALAALEARGELWRHVGKGTFVGARPVAEPSSVAAIARLSNPADVMRARLALEPQLAREAALHASAEDIHALEAGLAGCREAATWRQYEAWDNRLHRSIAEAAHSALLLAIFDTLNGVRRAVVWGRQRDERARPPADHHSFADHDAIVAAIAARDLAEAGTTMRRHLLNVQARLMEEYQAAG